MPPPLEAVSLDAAGTLFHLAEPVGVTYAARGRLWGIDLPPALLDRTFRSAWKRAGPLHAPVEPREMADPETSLRTERLWWRRVVEDTFLSACRESGLPGPDARRMEALFEDLFAEFGRPERWRLYPETLAVLDRLSARFRLIVLSNFDRRFHDIARGLGLEGRFEATLLSGECGVAKPDHGFFDLARNRLNLPADRILHVGDDPDADWRGGREAGLQVFELRRPEGSLADLLSLL